MKYYKFYIVLGLSLLSNSAVAQTEAISDFENYSIGKSEDSFSGVSQSKSYSIQKPNIITGLSSFKKYSIGKIEKPITSDLMTENKSVNLKSDSYVGTENENRIALVIGNSTYAHSSKLKNPVNDANDMAATLQEIGFEVIKVVNADYQKMRNYLKDFEGKISQSDIVLCYYAGHGIQVDGNNYLIPIDAKLDKKEHIKYETIDVSIITKIMEMSGNQKRLNIIILDACRNNPFRSWSRGGNSGLSKVEPPNGTLIAFATSPNSVASDGEGNNGLYTGELIKQLLIPQRIEDVFINTRIVVEEKSNFNQSPWEQAKLRGAFYLIK